MSNEQNQANTEEGGLVDPIVMCSACKNRCICEFHNRLMKLETHFSFNNRKGENHGYSFRGRDKVSELFAAHCDYYEMDKDDT